MKRHNTLQGRPTFNSRFAHGDTKAGRVRYPLARGRARTPAQIVGLPRAALAAFATLDSLHRVQVTAGWPTSSAPRAGSSFPEYVSLSPNPLSRRLVPINLSSGKRRSELSHRPPPQGVLKLAPRPPLTFSPGLSAPCPIPRPQPPSTQVISHTDMRKGGFQTTSLSLGRGP